MPDTCPICRKPSASSPRLQPFCSVRCANIDLGHWFTGAYAVPTSSEEDAPEEDDQ